MIFAEALKHVSQDYLGSHLHALLKLCRSKCWFTSHADCWARKGLLRVRLRTPGGAEVDFYNTHIEAGAEPRSLRSRARNFEVLAQTIERLSPWGAQLS